MPDGPHCPTCGQKRPTCRRCGTVLDESNARQSRGRYVGACRSCERTESVRRASRVRALKPTNSPKESTHG